MKNKVKKIVLTTGLLSLMLFSGGIVQNNPMGEYLNTMTGTITAQAAEQPAFSSYWFEENGQWRIRDGSGNIIKGAWVCDDAITTNGNDVWYLIDENGYMVYSGLVQDNTGNYYSLEMNHNGNYGMLRYASGNYDGVQLSLEGTHNGNFAKILNQDGIDALAAKYGVKHFAIDNSNCVYTSTFSVTSGGGSSNGSNGPSGNSGTQSGGSSTQTGDSSRGNVPRKSAGGNNITGLNEEAARNGAPMW